MKTLKIFKEKKEEEKIEMDEIMGYEGEWSKAGYSRDVNKVRIVDYRSTMYGSTMYDYYIHEDSDGEHTFYRNKK